MFQFSYALKVAERVKAKYERHPRYNPERDGRGIKGGCSTCFSLYDLHQARLMLDCAHREFLKKAIPWTHPLLALSARSAVKQESAPPLHKRCLTRLKVRAID